MSSTHLIRNDKEHSNDIAGLFEIFCKDKYDNWNEYLQDKEFFNLMTYLKPKYGNSIFHDMVNFVSNYENIPVIDILRDFGEFRQKYY